MQQTIANDAFAVFDDVLDEDTWSQVWTYFQFEDLSPTTRTAGAWKLEDGEVWAGPDFRASAPGMDDVETDYPTSTPVDHVVDLLLGAAPDLVPWIGTDWRYLAGRAYVYPAGSGLSWHRDDHEYYSGAFVYYAHPDWNVGWGGELLIADVENPTDLPVMPFRFDNREYSDLLMADGHGHFLQPRPNRLVILGNRPHRITPVSPAAGRAVRASLAGFFVRKNPEAASE